MRGKKLYQTDYTEGTGDIPLNVHYFPAPSAAFCVPGEHDTCVPT